MEPIINPMFFYFADTIPNIRATCVLMAALGAAYVCLRKIKSIDEDRPYKAPKSLIAAVVTGIVLAVFIPSQETLYKMAIAKFVTKDNIVYVSELVGTTANGVKDGVTDFVKDIMDYSADTVNEIRKGE